ncbi:YcjF family protein [Afipia clevelandensis]|uniref:TIGR01620 family protein n=1 Tax=Afipia clevelandensis ATCC 49720 TaxID=883079 RepID=K8P3H7_9BRAD|nr:TIGR01620 family protein [Afipia clevelandensis]EKS36031.1 TIGR01620 family protein [Afipia clevelandensis ATCC 49720]
MSDKPHHRKPAAFKLDDPRVILMDTEDEAVRSPRGKVLITPEADPAQLPVPIDDPAIPARKGFGWGGVFWTALGGLVVLGLGLGISNLVEELFNRSASLGYIGLVFAILAVIALVVIIAREALSLARLETIEKLHARANAVLLSDDRKDSDAIVRDLLKIAHDNPRLARARAALEEHGRDIIDGADMVRLAERELMTPLDQEARRLVSSAAQRVSIVTAVSPGAVIDMLFVFAAAVRLVRQLARLYGGRPGTLGMIRLMRHVIAHLALTGGMAASDSLIQQMLGHGITAKLSAKLGEGLLNGLLTARLGLAAIDVTRPLPFEALPRPALSDLAKDLLRRVGGDDSKS